MKKIRQLNASTEFSADDKSFLKDVEQAIVDESGTPVELNQLLVVKNDLDNTVALFMPSPETPEVPEGFTVVGTVTPNQEDNMADGVLGDPDAQLPPEEELSPPPEDDIPMEDMPPDGGEELDDIFNNGDRPSPDEEFNPWEDA